MEVKYLKCKKYDFCNRGLCRRISSEASKNILTNVNLSSEGKSLQSTCNPLSLMILSCFLIIDRTQCDQRAHARYHILAKPRSKKTPGASWSAFTKPRHGNVRVRLIYDKSNNLRLPRDTTAALPVISRVKSEGTRLGQSTASYPSVSEETRYLDFHVMPTRLRRGMYIGHLTDPLRGAGSDFLAVFNDQRSDDREFLTNSPK